MNKKPDRWFDWDKIDLLSGADFEKIRPSSFIKRAYLAIIIFFFEN